MGIYILVLQCETKIMCSKHVSSWIVVLYNCVSRVLDMYKHLCKFSFCSACIGFAHGLNGKYEKTVFFTLSLSASCW